MQLSSATLSASQPLLILVVGTPGSGKSFFARQFAEDYRFFYIDTGRYESELEGLGASNQEVTKLAKNLATATYEQALKSFKHIVFEGPFNSGREREMVIGKAKKAGFGVLTVWVQTDLETAQERSLNRDRRRQDDKYSLNLTKEEFENLSRAFEKPNPAKEICVVVSGKHDFKSQSVIILKKIAGLYVKSFTEGTSRTANLPDSPAPKTIIR
jgi:predicted kinase